MESLKTIYFCHGCTDYHGRLIHCRGPRLHGPLYFSQLNGVQGLPHLPSRSGGDAQINTEKLIKRRTLANRLFLSIDFSAAVEMTDLSKINPTGSVIPII